ncbi:DUF2515 family protein [Paenibacillus sp. N3.4]|uniref:DUF2515 family protein n=1 Tax=Paenibacillus sp. N3.4 TaxID=2603222 RepID=UPI0011CAFD5E|nr:DUF2515 family protein [Paenibacillus sp. N3.4]TXK77564.1 DUF2515 domain-containing protein [Paenibacillus sp. N3.4]
MGGTVKPNKGFVRTVLHKFLLSRNVIGIIQRISMRQNTDTDNDNAPQKLPIPTATVQRLKYKEIKQLQLQRAGVEGFETSEEEKTLVERVREQTRHANRNNVTRTHAYWTSYQQHPELHWALLAHMVSRNGGWCMTDLRGELLPHLLSTTMIDDLFTFLERANSLIFHDAYPQLLLYSESKKQNRSLFHLLPQLGVSSWMLPIWHDFWLYKESAALTVALIINEQNYMERQIIQNTRYQQTVLNAPLFKTQAWLQLNQVGFPFRPRLSHQETPTSYFHIAGLILENFTNLTERIEFGKSLYAILFAHSDVFPSLHEFASSTPHSGSRADYWPHLFTSIRKSPPNNIYQERLDSHKLRSDTTHLYSPSLADAWANRPMEPVEQGDWFTEVNQPMKHLCSIPVPSPIDMTNEVFFGLNKIELAILGAQALRD